MVIKMMKLSICPLDSQIRHKVEQLSVHQEQAGFVETTDIILSNIDQGVHGHVIINSAENTTEIDCSEIVGFFLIDTAYPRSYNFCTSQDIGLRSFFIDKNHQGHGYGKKAVRLLPEYLKGQYDKANSVYLTVNCKNPSAKHCYEAGGFIDTEKLYHGGDFGPQHIMTLPLQDKNS
jgi:RimJ/RimL family protein N-acetyltransferase